MKAVVIAVSCVAVIVPAVTKVSSAVFIPASLLSAAFNAVSIAVCCAAVIVPAVTKAPKLPELPPFLPKPLCVEVKAVVIASFLSSCYCSCCY